MTILWKGVIMENNYRQQNPEVLYTNDTISTVNRPDVKNLKILSINNERKRIRLCTHSDSNQVLHEMLIVHGKSTYVHPHKHPGKSESTHIIEGLVDIILFDDDGRIDRVIEMGDYASGKIFYYRIATPIFHTLIIRSDILVFHETTNGPFNKESTIFAPWAPEEADSTSVSHFLSNLNERVNFI